jgi:fumarylacetoacetate (FAA) hydrolase
LDRWDEVAPQLQRLAERLESGEGDALEVSQLGAPLPRAYEWLDGSAFIHHIELVRRARGAPLPQELYTEPLVYQGGSGRLLGPFSDVPLTDASLGLDFEAEVAIVVDDVPRGTDRSQAEVHIKLLMLVNDWTLRNLVPSELSKGFGFVVSKPATAFSPLAVTKDELGSSWQDGRLHLPIVSHVNGRMVGNPNAGPEMHFSFCDLLAHIVQTRSLTAGTIIGSGTVSNRDPTRGVACLAEQRTLEQIQSGTPRTRYLVPGDCVRIEMLDKSGASLFGAIEQHVIEG